MRDWACSMDCELQHRIIAPFIKLNTDYRRRDLAVHSQLRVELHSGPGLDRSMGVGPGKEFETGLNNGGIQYDGPEIDFTAKTVQALDAKDHTRTHNEPNRTLYCSQIADWPPKRQDNGGR